MDTRQATWHIDLLGRLRAEGTGQLLERFPTQKTAGLLALLAFPPARRRTREEVAGILWPDADGAAARDRLSQALGWLRSHLEPGAAGRGTVLFTDRLSLGFQPDAVTTDVAAFEAALQSGRRAADPVGRREALERAVAAYGGALLPDFYADWVLAERRRLQDAYLLALRQLAALHEQESEYETALGYARRALAVDPLLEEAHGDVIRILTAAGETASAARHYRDLEALLARELDAQPSAKVKALMAAAPANPARPRRVRAANGRARAVSGRPAVRSGNGRGVPAPPFPLPRPLTRFFGREAEIERAEAMLRDEGARLVTLTGIGGAGKTRLALAVAADLTTAFEGAVVFLPAADIDDARMLPTALAAALRLPNADTRTAMEQAVERLAARPFLLLLDNLEHLQAGAATFVRELLERAPALSVLATSRQRLGLDGERELPVAPLPFAAGDAETGGADASASVRLFVDRARSVRPDFSVTPANIATIHRLCERLDGIPLAIELCAAWAQTLTPSEMLEKLDQRFDLLVSRRSDITPRHRTLRAALEYSYLLLPGDLRRLFTQLSVFRGGWNLETAADVCGTAGGDGSDALSLLEGLTELRERSLIVADEVPGGENETQMRYRFLETLREFAGRQLTFAERTGLRRAHAVYFTGLAERAEEGMTGPDQERWLARLDRDQENLRTALAWSLEGGHGDMGLRLGGALRGYWWVRGYLEEGCQWLEKLLDGASSAPDVVLAKAWGAMGHLTWGRSDFPAARAAHDRALALRRAAGDRAGVAESLYHLGITTYRQHDYDASRAFLEESMAIAREQDDHAGIARALLNLGNIAYERQAYAEAGAYYGQSLELAAALGNRQRVRVALTNMGVLAMAEKEYARADEHLEAALVICRELTDNNGAATALVNQATVARLRGQNGRAHALFREGLKMADEVGDRHIIAHYLLQMGILETFEEKWGRGATLMGAARHLFEQVESPGWETHAEDYPEALAAASAALGEAAFEGALAAGGRMSFRQGVAYALA